MQKGYQIAVSVPFFPSSDREKMTTTISICSTSKDVLNQSYKNQHLYRYKDNVKESETKLNKFQMSEITWNEK